MVEPADLDIDGPVAPQQLNAGRLWAGGVATAVVAALVVIAGVYIARSILGIAVLAPKAAGSLGSFHHRGLRRGRRRGRAARHRPAACPAARNTPAAQLLHLDHRAGRSHPGGRPVQPAGHPAEQGLHRGDQSGRGRGRDLAADRRRARRHAARQPTPGAGSRRDARSRRAPGDRPRASRAYRRWRRRDGDRGCQRPGLQRPPPRAGPPVRVTPPRACPPQLVPEPVEVADQLPAQRPADRLGRRVGAQQLAELVLLLLGRGQVLLQLGLQLALAARLLGAARRP